MNKKDIVKLLSIIMKECDKTRVIIPYFKKTTDIKIYVSYEQLSIILYNYLINATQSTKRDRKTKENQRKKETRKDKTKKTTRFRKS